MEEDKPPEISANKSMEGNASKKVYDESVSPEVNHMRSLTPNANDADKVPTYISPTTPVSEKDYRKLYHEMRRRVLRVTEDNANALTKTTAELELMKKRCEAIMLERDQLKADHEIMVKEIETLNAIHCAPKVSRKPSEEVIMTPQKTRTNKKNLSTVTLQQKCELSSCVNEEDTSLIKCNACGIWVCENCTNAPIMKLKSIMPKCNSIFFACNGCSATMLHSSGKWKANNVDSDSSNKDTDDTEEIVQKVRTLFEQKLSEVESNLTKILEEKLEDKFVSINVNNGDTGSETVQKTYANVLGSNPTHIKEAIMEIKNDDKIEESEIEKRSRNLIIHGAEEIGEDSEGIMKEDEGYVKGILQKLGIPNDASTVLRLGKPNERKQRPIKVIMKNKEDKMMIFKNLKKLKGTEDEFGRISITDDYTIAEREEIKKWVVKAKQKSDQDPSKVYKVRGDPKNGLKLIWFAKNQ